MKKIPFNIKYRPQIESGECVVETRGGEEVEILDFENKLEGFPILARVGGKYNMWYSLDGCFSSCECADTYDLFIVAYDNVIFWKPSVDQMLALYRLAYTTNVVDDEIDDSVTKLYQDLKREFFKGDFNAELEFEKKNRTDFEKAVEKVVSEGFSVSTVKEQSDFLLGEAKKELEKQKIKEDENVEPHCTEEEADEEPNEDRYQYITPLEEALLDFYDDWHINYDYSLVNDKSEGLNKWTERIRELVQNEMNKCP